MMINGGFDFIYIGTCICIDITSVDMRVREEGAKTVVISRRDNEIVEGGKTHGK